MVKKCRSCGRLIEGGDDFWMDVKGVLCIDCADVRGLVEERSVDNGED